MHPSRQMDEETSLEMKKMIKFITQEALEKAKEIEIRGEEEFNIEKAKLVRKETAQIEDSYSKRIKAVSVNQKM
jgi:V-type H+-transporting ATPase subunit E